MLLRERKRHTAHRVASTPYVVLTGYPPRQGTPPGQGTPPARVPPRPGYPPARVPPWLDLAGYPPGWTWQGTPPQLPHGILGNVAKHYGIRVPPPRCELTNKVKLLPSRRTTYAGSNNSQAMYRLCRGSKYPRYYCWLQSGRFGSQILGIFREMCKKSVIFSLLFAFELVFELKIKIFTFLDTVIF